MVGDRVLRPLRSQRKTVVHPARDSVMDQALDQSNIISTNSASDDPDQASFTPPSTSTPSKSKQKATPSSTPKSKKRKSRTKAYADDSDSDYRARTSSRKSSRRTRRASFESDPDGDYGGSMTPTRKMTRPILSRHSYRELISAANGEDDEDDEDEREGLCLEKCPYFPNDDMIECDRIECGRKFHLGCVGFSAKPTLGENKWWFCPECRKIEERGEKKNGLYALGDSEDEDGGE